MFKVAGAHANGRQKTKTHGRGGKSQSANAGQRNAQTVSIVFCSHTLVASGSPARICARRKRQVTASPQTCGEMVCKQKYTGKCPNSKDECLNHRKRRFRAEGFAVDRCRRRYWHHPITVVEEGDGAVKTRAKYPNGDQMADISSDTGVTPKRRQPPDNHNF